MILKLNFEILDRYDTNYNEKNHIFILVTFLILITYIITTVYKFVNILHYFYLQNNYIDVKFMYGISLFHSFEMEKKSRVIIK